MAPGKTISVYLDPELIARLDALRTLTPRSVALTKALQYLLSQNDEWIKALICTIPSNT